MKHICASLTSHCCKMKMKNDLLKRNNPIKSCRAVMAGCFQGDRFNATVLFSVFYAVRWLSSHLSPQMFLLFLGSCCTGLCSTAYITTFPLFQSCALSATLWQIKAAKSKTLPPMFTSNGQRRKKNQWDQKQARQSLWKPEQCVSTFDCLVLGLESYGVVP